MKRNSPNPCSENNPWTERHIEFTEGKNEYIRASHVRKLETVFRRTLKSLKIEHEAFWRLDDQNLRDKGFRDPSDWHDSKCCLTCRNIVDLENLLDIH
jgi:hypothetical protein